MIREYLEFAKNEIKELGTFGKVLIAQIPFVLLYVSIITQCWEFLNMNSTVNYFMCIGVCIAISLISGYIVVKAVEIIKKVYKI